ncbi:MAG: hypothetical protein M9894_20435 [Planctomycetes bacterium]|nr:hypothetical protein [Planctomycetota bacterium]
MGRRDTRAPLLELPFREVTSRVREHLARGQTKEAVELARDAHARLATPDSEALAIEAYLARIAGLEARGLAAEARALTDSVRKRFPGAAERLTDRAVSRALAELVRPLGDPGLDPDARARVEARVRAEVVDLAALAGASSLPEDHALRRAAAALCRAFEAATTGPVTDDDLLLPEVSRRSPLAPWKALARAIACYHRHEDDRCREAIAAIPPDAAAARAIPALRALLEGQAVPGITPTQTSLGAALAAVDAALERAGGGGGKGKALRAIEVAVEACAREAPDLLDLLRQRLAVLGLALGLPTDRLLKAQGGTSRHDQRFWRLLALLFERQGGLVDAASAWLEALRVGALEGRFRADGPEAAAVFLRAADLLERSREASGSGDVMDFRRRFEGHGGFYRGQPPDVAAWAPPAGPPDLWFLDPARLLERACAADPHAAAFQAWLAHARRAGPPKEVDRVAERWHAALPDDPAPLLALATSAEARGALSLALRHVEQAEQRDALDPAVRRARMRLLVSAARRHAKQKKPHLLAKDVVALEALPEAQEGRRPALLAALRWVEAGLRGDAGAQAGHLAAATRRLDSDLGAALLLESVGQACGLKQAPATPQAANDALPPALGRAALIAADAGLALRPPGELRRRLRSVLGEADGAAAASSAELRALAEALLEIGDHELAHAVAGAGLRRGGATTARFLLLRAASLPGFSRSRRADACLAALTLARRDRDQALVDEAVRLLRVSAPGDEDAPAPSHEELEGLIAAERGARDYPRQATAADRARDGRGCLCGECRPGGASTASMAGVIAELLELAARNGGELPDLDALDPGLASLLGEVFAPGGRRRRR